MPGAAETSLLAPDAIARWRLYAAMEESIRLHAQEQAAVQVRALVVMPYVPGQGSRRELLRSLRRRGSLGRAPLQRGADEHRRAAAASLAHTELFRAELEGLRLPTRLLNGEQLAELYWQRFNPTVADHSRSGGQALGAEVLCDLDGVLGPVLFGLEEAAQGPAGNKLSRASGRNAMKPSPPPRIGGGGRRRRVANAVADVLELPGTGRCPCP